MILMTLIIQTTLNTFVLALSQFHGVTKSSQEVSIQDFVISSIRNTIKVKLNKNNSEIKFKRTYFQGP